MAPDRAEKILAEYGELDCPIWSGLDPADKRRMFQTARVERIPRRRIIFHQGDVARGFYVVAEGTVKIFKLSPDGQEQVIFVAGPGDNFAEAALFAGQDYPASAQALEDSVLIFFEKKQFTSLLHDNPDMALKMLGSLSHWLRRMVQRFESVTLADAETRLARFLLEQAEREKPLADGAHLIELPMKKNVLASLLNVRDATLSRLLARFEQQGLIRLEGRSIRVLKFEQLQGMVG